MHKHTFPGAWLRYVALPCLLILAVACVGVATAKRSTPDVTVGHAPRVCFPVKQWGPVADRYAPCVKVTRVSEDGSFRFAVSDKGGTVRYSGSVGNLDDGPSTEEVEAEDPAEVEEAEPVCPPSGVDADGYYC